MIKRMVVMLVLMSLLAAGVIWFTRLKTQLIGKALSGIAAMPQTVSTEPATYAEWQSSMSAVGSMRAVKGADLAAEIPGVVDAINFESGDEVQAGALLLQLRPDDAPGRLEQLQAVADLAQITYQRDLRQLHAQAVPQATVDTDASNLKSAQAQVEQQSALLAEKSVRAPFAGRLGIRQVDLGQYLNAGTAIVTLQALDPMYIDFSLPQQALRQVAVGQPVTIAVDTYPGVSFPGVILAIDSKVDTTTRNVQLRASLANPQHKLLPGMYGTVSVVTGAKQRLLTLRQTDIAFNPYGSTVFIVTENGKDAEGHPRLIATQNFVTTGATQGDRIAILSGVKENDVVVSAGQIKLRNGSVVLVNNTVQPTDDPRPSPPNQ